jgi:hypothetical protein
MNRYKKWQYQCIAKDMVIIDYLTVTKSCLFLKSLRL